MASRTLRFAIASAKFPFISTQQPRAVVSPDLDSAGRVPRQFFGTDESLDYNTLTPLYMENVVPVVAGWRSVRYEDALPTPRSENAAFFAAGYGFLLSLRYSDPAGTAVPSGASFMTGDQILPMEVNTQMVNDQSGNVTFYVRFDPSSGAPSPVWQKPAVYQTDTVTIESLVNTQPLLGVSQANVQGAQFVCVPGSGIFYVGHVVRPGNVTEFALLRMAGTSDAAWVAQGSAGYTTTNFQLIANLPFARSEIKVISASMGFLLVAAKNQIAWATYDGVKFDFEEFANNEITGSGTRIPDDLVGDITALAPVPGGFLIFSSQSCVAAFYSSSNSGVPWVFRKVANAGGVPSRQYLTQEDETGGIYAYTTAGLQRITLNGAIDLEPAASDFLMGRKQESWEPSTKKVAAGSVPSSFNAKLALIGSRYLFISYSAAAIATFGYALVYDTSLKRWGKIAREHREVVQLVAQEAQEPLTIAALAGISFNSLASLQINQLETSPASQVSRARQSVALLRDDGSLEHVILDERDSSDNTTDGVVVFGKFQLQRSRITVVQRVSIEGAELNCDVVVQPSIDGRTVHRTEDYMEVENVGDLRTFGGEAAGINHNIVVTGQFHLSSLIVEADTEGTF